VRSVGLAGQQLHAHATGALSIGIESRRRRQEAPDAHQTQAVVLVGTAALLVRVRVQQLDHLVEHHGGLGAQTRHQPIEIAQREGDERAVDNATRLHGVNTHTANVLGNHLRAASAETDLQETTEFDQCALQQLRFVGFIIGRRFFRHTAFCQRAHETDHALDGSNHQFLTPTNKQNT
jgi:hypothetical protein